MERDGIGSMLLEIRIFRCELGLFLHFYKCCLLGLCLDCLAYGAVLWKPPKRLTWDGFWSVVYLPLDMFAVNSFTLQIQRPPPLSPHLRPQKSHFIRKQTARWFQFIFIIFLKLLLCGPNARRKFALFFLGPRVLPASVCLPLPCGQRRESWANFSLPTFYLTSQIFPCVAFEILVIVCGHWWVFGSACVHLPPGVMMCRNVRSVTPLPDLSDSRALQRLYHHLLQHYGYYFIALTLSWANPKCP